MRKSYWSLGVVAACFIASSVFGAQPGSGTGDTKFKELCAVCHPNGGNIINPQKTLMKKVREANKIKTAADIIKNMRNPGPGMTKFDQKTVSDKDALAIAEYILKAF
jgi:cytochrome c6